MERKAWIVTVNSDLTEGKGVQRILCICDLEATAIRKARRADVQGTDGTVTCVELIKCNNRWYGPVNIEDQKYQDKLNKKNEAIQKAISSGLTKDDLKALRY